ncbi:UDP-4-amino-4, 6-dideoxy-N-acetyl-beta-L-altrosamine transaminase [Pseudoruegeria aquimaris]|uniref:UDP-4-amino-4, 6-dideoxy-N-acetyl-beta-L-altrosamine transaminase n=1 Tax=Pseudoruegeria aquimaris TaxID=393663 RepID=A0A1Y5TD15_9RHOB|nr:UDP-4-amino-4,6-dideoxy-N-acetyl-beta-L-altrosamine transaminase [Pseudoruegeria aquimaris]SLN57669.1 UDP-4-amino-4, 6-dideoxy-N-acetyl-beta-L-altrosamine transaminase [Pseudoruegeria aquimaris]
MIPYGRQDIRQEDIDAVVDVLKSDFLTQGPQVPAFEQAVAKAAGARHAVAVNSATSALHIACLALGLGPGDLLWTSPITFVASANVGRLCGADVDFVDVDPDTANMCPQALAEKLAAAKAAGRLPKVLIPVHMCGQSCDMAAIGALARDYGVKIVEDASHAIGGSFEGKPVGDCRHSDITVFSFHPVKIVTTAEGGVATTQDADLARRMELFRSHGVTRDPALMEGESEGGWYYQQVELGLNYRMTELQAALGVTQMTRLAEYVDRRNALAERYDAALGNLPLKRPGRLAQARSSFHLYVIRVEAARRRAVFDALRAEGIGVNVHYIPVHTQPYYRRLGFAPGQFPQAEGYYAQAISIPLYHGLTEAAQDQVVAAVEKALA